MNTKQKTELNISVSMQIRSSVNGAVDFCGNDWCELLHELPLNLINTPFA